MTGPEILTYLAAAVSVGAAGFVSVGIPVIGYWVKSQDKRAHGLSVRCGTLEQSTAGQAAQIDGLREDMREVKGMLGRILERLPHRPEMGSVADT